MGPPKKRKLPKPLPAGFVLTDTEKKKWKLGKIIGQGGFGLIYLASRDVDRPAAADTDFVVKLEYHENGPLFSELKFYQRAAKSETVHKWVGSRKLDFLGVPTYWGSGLAEYNNLRYRFMVMDRLGTDLQKICDRNGGRLKKATVLQLGHDLVNVLEYIHENEYVHADIKAANLMQGYRDPDKVYLADYGLCYRYCPEGEHKEYKEDPRKGHNGTIEYTSIDAHKGVSPSRRSDLEILGFCLLHWLCGSLPWDGVLKDPVMVQKAKTRLMDNLPESVKELSLNKESRTDEVASFLLYVKSLGYQEKPNYQHLRGLFSSPGKRRLDLSKPGGTAAVCPSTSTAGDPGTMEKKPGRPRKATKAKPVAPVSDDEEEEEKEEEETKRRKPAPTRRRAAPKSPAVGTRRSTRSRIARSYRDESDDEEEEDDDDEEDVQDRPKPIDPRYLRGPPIGPRPSSKQIDFYTFHTLHNGEERPHGANAPIIPPRQNGQHKGTFRNANGADAETLTRRERGFRRQREDQDFLGCGYGQQWAEWPYEGGAEVESRTQGIGTFYPMVCVGALFLLGALFLGSSSTV